MMKRREFIAGLGSAAAAWPVVARAQQAVMPVIGTLYSTSAAEWPPYMAGFRVGLSDMGFVEGRNVAIDYRWADNRNDRLPGLAADLVARKVALILAGGASAAVRAAMAATQTIPLVFTTGGDPIDNGFVASLNRPGGNVTGVTWIATELIPKRLELLREVVPAASRIAVLRTRREATVEEYIERIKTAADHLGVGITVLNCDTEADIETAFTIAVSQRINAVYAGVGAFFVSRREQIAALALHHRLPTMSVVREAALAGQLMSYSTRIEDGYRQAGVYAGRILKGEKPADLPVTQPTKIELVINLKTAKALGLTIPETLLATADELIQ
jgi:putative tryptophan/tyrosine transport system substrate-binding protein